ncbi:solute carrier family 23 protein [Nesterenkonia sphaerica]|uniref:Xanthine/uracil/vitamin C permease n=1 Tax=Nesterenkonia sphaerica TaxID=1804988 RepID=A0A5R9AL72_9MICC|nr:solute carrier family 23 protein [Nesterenkonia sphaerica]TLP79343.1 xanthine/uracil/vitamin C permease [Nesterenkonia sphaerica]
MAIYEREPGSEQPYWGLGPFKVRLPLVHYRLEAAEFVQGLILFVVSLGMIPLLEQYLGVPYDIALAYVVVCGVGFLLPTLLGVPMVPGWITPAIPVVVLFLGDFEPGPESIQALFALQFLVFLIMFILGITRWGEKLIRAVPASIKAGILIGAGIAAIMGEVGEGEIFFDAPISLTVGALLALCFLYSKTFLYYAGKNQILGVISSYGLAPAIIVGVVVAYVFGEFPRPEVEWGITSPDFVGMWSYLPFTVGFPSPEVFLLAVPTALIAYVIAFGDMIVGNALIQQADEDRPDEKIDAGLTRLHLVTSLRNLLHSFFAPYPGLAGPVFTAPHAAIVARYRLGKYNIGRKPMDSIHGGMGSFWIAGFIALFVLPLVTVFQPVLPLTLALTLVLTGYVTIAVGMGQITTTTQRGVAGVTAVVLALHGAIAGVAVGLALYFLIEWSGKESKTKTEPRRPDTATSSSSTEQPAEDDHGDHEKPKDD